MRAGQLDKRITIKEVLLTRDAIGGYTKTVNARGTFWAKITPVSASEPYLHDQLQHSITHRITTRKFSLGANGGFFGARFFGRRFFGGRFWSHGNSTSSTGVKADMLVAYKTRTFKIIGIRDIEEDGVTQEIMAQELPAKD